MGHFVEELPEGEIVFKVVIKKKYTNLRRIGSILKEANEMCTKSKKLTMFTSLLGKEAIVVVMKEKK